MRGVNKCIFIGNLAADPEIRAMPNGKLVGNFRIGVSEQWKDQAGAKQERTEWVSCVVYDKLAEIAEKYLKKGAKVFIEGKQRTRKWQAQDGSDKYTTETIVNELQMLDGNQVKPDSAPQRRPAQGAPQQNNSAPGGDPNGFDIDVPFLQHDRFMVV
jgi:single-strand DNA-binding protein